METQERTRKEQEKERKREGGRKEGGRKEGGRIEAEWKRLDWKKFAGWMSGVTMVENFCTYPLLLLKTRQQVHPSLLLSSPIPTPSSSPSLSPLMAGRNTLMETMKGIIRREGARGMYRGFWTYSLIPLPKCTYFLTYHWMKDFLLLQSSTTITNQMIAKSVIITTPLLAGISAELVANVFFVPIELIVQRIQITSTKQQERGVAMEMVRGIYREEGVRGFYRGYGATMITFGISSGVYWMAYEYSKSFLSSSFLSSSSSPSPSLPFLPKLNPSPTFFHLHPTDTTHNIVHHPTDAVHIDNDNNTVHIDNDNNTVHIDPTDIDRNIDNDIPHHYYNNEKGEGKEGRRRGVQFIAGFIAGVTSSVFSNPFDVVKTRLQTQLSSPSSSPLQPQLSSPSSSPLQPQLSSSLSLPSSTSSARSASGQGGNGGTTWYRNTMEGMGIVYRTEGMRGFTRGLFAKSMRAGPFAAAYSLLYEQVLSWSIKSS